VKVDRGEQGFACARATPHRAGGVDAKIDTVVLIGQIAARKMSSSTFVSTSALNGVWNSASAVIGLRIQPTRAPLLLPDVLREVDRAEASPETLLPPRLRYQRKGGVHVGGEISTIVRDRLNQLGLEGCGVDLEARGGVEL
jgi:hypothetical protein